MRKPEDSTNNSLTLCFALDYDGSLCPLVDDGTLFYANHHNAISFIIDKIHILRETQPDVKINVVILSGSARQSITYNLLGMIQNDNGCCFEFYQLFVDDLKERLAKKFGGTADAISVELCKLTLEDLEKNTPVGEHFNAALEIKLVEYIKENNLDIKKIQGVLEKQNTGKPVDLEERRKHTEWVNYLVHRHDYEKRALVFTHLHYLASQYNGEIHYYLLDDMIKILKSIDSFFSQLPFLLPKNCTVNLIHYLSGRINSRYEIDPIEGVGEKRNNFSALAACITTYANCTDHISDGRTGNLPLHALSNHKLSFENWLDFCKQLLKSDIKLHDILTTIFSTIFRDTYNSNAQHVDINVIKKFISSLILFMDSESLKMGLYRLSLINPDNFHEHCKIIFGAGLNQAKAINNKFELKIIRHLILGLLETDILLVNSIYEFFCEKKINFYPGLENLFLSTAQLPPIDPDTKLTYNLFQHYFLFLKSALSFFELTDICENQQFFQFALHLSLVLKDRNLEIKNQFSIAVLHFYNLFILDSDFLPNNELGFLLRKVYSLFFSYVMSTTTMRNLQDYKNQLQGDEINNFYFEQYHALSQILNPYSTIGKSYALHYCSKRIKERSTLSAMLDKKIISWGATPKTRLQEIQHEIIRLIDTKLNSIPDSLPVVRAVYPVLKFAIANLTESDFTKSSITNMFTHWKNAMNYRDLKNRTCMETLAWYQNDLLCDHGGVQFFSVGGSRVDHLKFIDAFPEIILEITHHHLLRSQPFYHDMQI